jgi:hypothetical protein
VSIKNIGQFITKRLPECPDIIHRITYGSYNHGPTSWQAQTCLLEAANFCIVIAVDKRRTVCGNQIPAIHVPVVAVHPDHVRSKGLIFQGVPK